MLPVIRVFKRNNANLPTIQLSIPY